MKFLITGALGLMFCLSAVGQSKFVVYSNQQFRYSIEYPSDFYSLDKFSMQSNGAKFTSAVPSAKMMVWARQTAKPDISGEFEIFLKHYGRVVKTKESTENSFLIGGAAGRDSFYVKGLHRQFKGVNTIYLVTIDYPTDDEKYKSVVEGILASFKLIDSDTK